MQGTQAMVPAGLVLDDTQTAPEARDETQERDNREEMVVKQADQATPGGSWGIDGGVGVLRWQQQYERARQQGLAAQVAVKQAAAQMGVML